MRFQAADFSEGESDGDAGSGSDNDGDDGSIGSSDEDNSSGGGDDEVWQLQPPCEIRC